MKIVYSAVRTVSVNKAVCASSLKGFYSLDEKSLNKAVCASSLKGYFVYMFLFIYFLYWI
jgi:hypothetical protein